MIPPLPPSLSWLDDGARILYHAMHRYSSTSGGVPNVPWGWDWSGRHHEPGCVPWERIADIHVAWCFYAFPALSGQPRERLEEVVAWARAAATARDEPSADDGRLRPFSALAEEAERLMTGGAP